MMIREELKKRFEKVINSLSCGGKIEFSIIKSNCTRFANSVITQNSTNVEQILNVTLAEKVENGYKLIERTTGNIENVEIIVEELLNKINESSVNDEFKGFLKNYRSKGVKTFYPSTGAISLIDKAELVKKIVENGEGLVVGGILVTEHEQIFTINSEGQKRCEDFSTYKVDVKYENSNGNSSSFQETGRNIENFDYETLSKKCSEKCRKNVDLSEIEEGEYDVLFAPSATSELIYFLSHIAFGGREYKQKRSFIYGKLGEKIINNSKITLINNPFNPLTLTENYDSEGMARREVILIKNGIAKSIATNSLVVDRIEDSNGNSMGNNAYCMLMELEGGTRNSEDIIKDCNNTIYISRFHYPTIDNPNKVILKGSTKDGTFLIKNGELKPVKNLEFIFEIPYLLENIVELSENREVLPQGSLASSLPGANIVPYSLAKGIKLENGKMGCLR